MRRRVFLIALPAFAVAVTFAACADLGGLSGANDEDAGALDRGVPAAPLDAADDGARADVAVEDATSRDDATTTVDASGCTTCDCDKDSYEVRDAGCGLVDGSFDCDDTDPLIRPGGASFVNEKWTSSHLPAGDWNCDGVVVKQYAFNVTCPAFGNCLLQGFEGNPGCGETGSYVECKVASGNFCQKGPVSVRTQACK